MSVLSTLVAYAAARPAPGTAVATVLGTMGAAGGALALNQWWERRTDALMARTRGRPLPQGDLCSGAALAWSLGLATAGTTLFAVKVNATAAAVAAATILLYGVVYTPLKRRTRWATEIGAVSGALPAVLGNAAADDLFAPVGLTLALVILLWQMPHFFAIGWRHRADYRAAGFPLLPALDSGGARTATWSFGYSLALLVVSLVPWALGWAGAVYGATAALAGLWLAGRAWTFVAGVDRERAARRLFAATLIYLPAVMAALLSERLFSG